MKCCENVYCDSYAVICIIASDRKGTYIRRYKMRDKYYV